MASAAATMLVGSRVCLVEDEQMFGLGCGGRVCLIEYKQMLGLGCGGFWVDEEEISTAEREKIVAMAFLWLVGKLW